MQIKAALEVQITVAPRFKKLDFELLSMRVLSERFKNYRVDKSMDLILNACEVRRI